MIIILSPAKTLDFSSSKTLNISASTPVFLKKAQILADELKKFTCQEIAEICNISPKLAELNHQRWQNFNKQNYQQAKQAILAFRGDVYKQLNLFNYTNSEITYLQNNVLILSGLYGILKPFDAILPYRLEMSSSFVKYNFFTQNLYKFWQDDLTKYCQNHQLIINLASQEYAKALHKSSLNIIEMVFLDYQQNKLKNIGINAKKARGNMADLMISNNIKTIADLKTLKPLNYQLSTEHSSNQQLVFIR
jgi:cytoplasmic iron level regulating protein YaaA (DUF328/UPF0246 family)